MKEKTINNFFIDNDTLKQFKNLTVKEEKLFYYAFGKLQIKAKSIDKETIDTIWNIDEMNVKISYDEIKILNGVARVDKNNYADIEKKLISNACAIKCWNYEEDKQEVIFLYSKISFNNKNRVVEIKFNDEAIILLKKIEMLSGNSNINVEEICKIKNSNEFKLYLYCLTVLRGNKGIIKISIEKLREILNNTVSLDDRAFYSRYINIPSKKITENNDINLKIYTKRENEIVTISVNKK